MSTILRVKRKKDDEPLDALLISCKRQKVETDASAASTPLTALVKFAGTVDEKQEDCIVQHITKTLSKDVLKANFKQHVVDLTKKIRDKKKKESSESRYKIINSIRSLDTSTVDDLEEDLINIIDIEETKDIPNGEGDSGYVYDLYYTQTKEALHLENLVSVLPVEEDLVFEDQCRDNEEGYINESEDSNSESNWKNDYPDSDHSETSVGEQEIRKAIENMNIDDELSSDSDDFVYGLDEDDVEKYGYKYAKYKERMKKEKEEYDNGIDVNSDLSENENNERDFDELEECDGNYGD